MHGNNIQMMYISHKIPFYNIFIYSTLLGLYDIWQAQTSILIKPIVYYASELYWKSITISIHNNVVNFLNEEMLLHQQPQNSPVTNQWQLRSTCPPVPHACLEQWKLHLEYPHFISEHQYNTLSMVPIEIQFSSITSTCGTMAYTPTVKDYNFFHFSPLICIQMLEFSSFAPQKLMQTFACFTNNILLNFILLHTQTVSVTSSFPNPSMQLLAMALKMESFSGLSTMHHTYMYHQGLSCPW